MLLELRVRHTERLTRSVSLAFGPDGKTLVTACADGRAVLWDAVGGRELAAWDLKTRIDSVALSPDGKRIATGCADNLIRLWPVPQE